MKVAPNIALTPTSNISFAHMMGLDGHELARLVTVPCSRVRLAEMLWSAARMGSVGHFLARSHDPVALLDAWCARPGASLAPHERRTALTCLEPLLGRLRKAAMASATTVMAAPAFDGDVYAVDDAVARVLDAHAPRGPEVAAAMRAKSRAAVARWRANPLELSALVSRVAPDVDFTFNLLVLITDVAVHEARLLLRAKSTSAGLSAEVLRTAIVVSSPSVARVTETTIHDGAGVLVARLSPPANTQVDLLAAVKSIPLLAPQRLFRWLLNETHARREAGERTAPRIVVIGGLQALAAKIGLPSNKDPQILSAALTALQCVHLVLPGGEYGGFLTWSRIDAVGGRPAKVTITPGDVLLPDFISTMPKGVGTRRTARQLVPVPMAMPAFVGREREHAAQSIMQLAVLADMRAHVEDLVTNGLSLPRGRWLELAADAGVPESVVEEMREAWLAGVDSVPAFLIRVDRDRYSLAPAYANELAVLREGAEREARGRVGAALRRARRGAPPVAPRRLPPLTPAAPPVGPIEP